MASILRAVQLPELGGDTCFASMYAAYDALSPPMRALLDGLRAVHDITRSLQKAIRDGHSSLDLAEMQQRCPPVEHNVVVTHPETGRKALFLNRNSTTHLDGAQRTRERRAPAVPVRPRTVARVPVPLPLGAGLDRVLGQPLPCSTMRSPTTSSAG